MSQTDVYASYRHPDRTPAAGEWIIEGTMLPTGNRRLCVRDGLIVDEVSSAAQRIVTDGFILPGLVDAHCHIGLGSEGAVDDRTAAQQAQTDRDSGVLLIRDAGAPSDTRWLNEPGVLAPLIIRSGRHIARPKRYIRHFGVEIEPENLVDEVRRQASASDGWVKLVGDWIDRSAGDLQPLWPADIARAAIDAAHSMNVKVTAHCFAEESVAQLVDAGIDCIEHGTGITPQVAETMAERQVACVPTMTNLELFPTFANLGQAKFPIYAAHMRDLHVKRWETMHMLVDCGVPLYCGTDSGGTLGHGRIAEEIALMAKIADNRFALAAASWEARSWLGAGCLELGDRADLVVYDEDPYQQIATVSDPRLIMLGGVIVAAR